MDNLNLRGQPDPSLVNRHEKWEVDHFSNYMLIKHGYDSAKVRRMLALAPGNLRSREHLEQWIITNWLLYI
ncbi:hypothetical protein J2X56_001579 [Herbaspirillum sp. 1173]|uniref:hypothetical protein n=1 Tax=Herbaspirillum sp. 1173 TaxID=2817734 RepID=UPI0028560560|nr:hypothetical protein [Herbaspirillum sp. 1173]MDR6739565.1 hypothetical protein [Herbaspirillum sp. 1173]